MDANQLVLTLGESITDMAISFLRANEPAHTNLSLRLRPLSLDDTLALLNGDTVRLEARLEINLPAGAGRQLTAESSLFVETRLDLELLQRHAKRLLGEPS